MGKNIQKILAFLIITTSLLSFMTVGASAEAEPTTACPEVTYFALSGRHRVNLSIGPYTFMATHIQEFIVEQYNTDSVDLSNYKWGTYRCGSHQYKIVVHAVVDDDPFAIILYTQTELRKRGESSSSSTSSSSSSSTSSSSSSSTSSSSSSSTSSGASNPSDVDVQMGNNGKLDMEGLPSDRTSAWNSIFSRFKDVIVGFTGAGTLFMVVLFVMQITKLGASAGNPHARSQALKGVMWTGIATTLFGSVTVIIGFFYNAI